MYFIFNDFYFIKHPIFKANSVDHYLARPEVKKNISCSTQLSMTFFLLINVKMPTIGLLLAFYTYEKKKSVTGSSEPEKC